MKKILIGLDFDGVLHSVTGENILANVPHINELIQELNIHQVECSIVITSTYRKQLSLQKIASFFSPLTQQRMIGVTPDFENKGYDRDLEFAHFCKDYEIKNNISFDLVYAIDDNARLFSHLPNLIFKTDSYQGFNEEKKNEFIQFVLEKLNLTPSQSMKNKL
jgi:hypothetical protein